MSSDNWQKSLKTIHERNQYLLESEALSDIVFLFQSSDEAEETEQIKAHKFELAKGSSVFEKMFYGNTENITELDIKDFNKKSFYEMIKFLYLEEIDVNAENALDILSLSRKYNIDALEENYSDFITSNMSVDNVCKLLESSLKQDNVSLKIKCVKFIEENALEVLQHSSIVEVDKKTFHVLLDVSPTHCGPTVVDFFNAAIKWAQNQCKLYEIENTSKNNREILGNLFNLICFPNMEIDEFVKCLEEYDQLFTIEEIGQIFFYIHLKKKRNFTFKVQKTSLVPNKLGLPLPPITLEFHSQNHRNDNEYVHTFSVNEMKTLTGFRSTDYGFIGDIIIRIKDSYETLNSTKFVNLSIDLILDKPMLIRPNINYEIVMKSKSQLYCYLYYKKSYTLGSFIFTSNVDSQECWSPIYNIHFSNC